MQKIDIKQLAQSLDFDVEDVQMLLEVFFQSAQDNLNQLQIALKQDDYETLALASHSIKGSAANLELDEISSVALEIEKAAKAKQSIDYAQKIQQLQNMVSFLQE